MKDFILPSGFGLAAFPAPSPRGLQGGLERYQQGAHIPDEAGSTPAPATISISATGRQPRQAQPLSGRGQLRGPRLPFLFFWLGRKRPAAPAPAGPFCSPLLPHRRGAPSRLMNWFVLASRPRPALFLWCSRSGRCVPPPRWPDRLGAWLWPGRSVRTPRRLFLLLVNGVLRVG